MKTMTSKTLLKYTGLPLLLILAGSLAGCADYPVYATNGYGTSTYYTSGYSGGIYYNNGYPYNCFDCVPWGYRYYQNRPIYRVYPVRPYNNDRPHYNHPGHGSWPEHGNSRPHDGNRQNRQGHQDNRGGQRQN